MSLIITIYVLFINAYYISSFTSLYIDLITIDVILLNLNRCLLFFSGGGGKCLGGHMSGGVGANVGEGQMLGRENVRGGEQISEYLLVSYVDNLAMSEMILFYR